MVCEGVSSEAHHLVRSPVSAFLAANLVGACVESLSPDWGQCILLVGEF